MDAPCRGPLFPFLMQQLSERAHCNMWDRHLEKRTARETPGKLTLSVLIIELTLTYYKQMLTQVHVLPDPRMNAFSISNCRKTSQHCSTCNCLLGFNACFQTEIFLPWSLSKIAQRLQFVTLPFPQK